MIAEVVNDIGKDYLDKEIGYEAAESLPQDFKEFLNLTVDDLNVMMEKELCKN